MAKIIALGPIGLVLTAIGLSWGFGAGAPAATVDATRTQLINRCFSQAQLRLPPDSAFMPTGTTLVWEAETRSCLLRRNYAPRARKPGDPNHYLILEQAGSTRSVPSRPDCQSGWRRSEIRHPRLGSFGICFTAVPKGPKDDILAVASLDQSPVGPINASFVGKPKVLKVLLLSLAADD